MCLRSPPRHAPRVHRLRVGLDAPLGDDEPQEHASWYPEDTLFGIELHAFRLETSECHFKVGKEVRGLPRLDYDVIDVGLDCATDVFAEHMVHAPLVRRARIPQSDQLATSFITPFGMYCYVTMPFGLRNAGAT